MLKRSVIVVWSLGTVLAVSHLMFLGGSGHSREFWVGSVVLLACYSLPFVALLTIHVPQKPSLERVLTLATFIAVLAISIFIPARRFLPGYHPVALEGLAYFFIPLFQCGLIGFLMVVRLAMS